MGVKAKVGEGPPEPGFPALLCAGDVTPQKISPLSSSVPSGRCLLLSQFELSDRCSDGFPHLLRRC
jgi:hypothetical protein